MAVLVTGESGGEISVGLLGLVTVATRGGMNAPIIWKCRSGLSPHFTRLLLVPRWSVCTWPTTFGLCSLIAEPPSIDAGVATTQCSPAVRQHAPRLPILLSSLCHFLCSTHSVNHFGNRYWTADLSFGQFIIFRLILKGLLLKTVTYVFVDQFYLIQNLFLGLVWFHIIWIPYGFPVPPQFMWRLYWNIFESY